MEILDIGDDSINQWLVENQNYIKLYKNDENSELSKEAQNSLIPLSSFLQRVQLFLRMYEGKIAEKPLIPSIHRKLTNESAFLARVHFYVQTVISEMMDENYKSIFNSTHQFLDYFMKNQDTINEYLVYYNERAFLYVFFGEIPKVQQLLAYDSLLVKSISKSELDIGEKANQAAILRNILFSQRSFYDNKNCIVHHNSQISKFEQLVYHESFYFAPNIMLLVDRTTYTDTHKFSNGCLETLNKMIEEFDISDEDDRMIFKIIFFRSIFSTVYSSASDFIDGHNETSFRSISEKLTLEDIAVDKTILPIDEAVECHSLRDIISRDEKLSNCANNLILLSFMTSPFDILTTLHYILSEIKLYALEKASNKDEAFTFDCIFGIFLFVLVCSDFPNVEEVFKLVQMFTPQDDLNGPLEYAFATVSATLLQCEKLVNIAKTR